MKVAGIVTEAQHRVSKKGTGWGLFTIQDFRGSLEMRMFSENYMKYKNLFEVGEALYIEGIWQESWKGGNYSFEVKNVRLLESIGEEMTQSITLKIPVEKLSGDVVESINNLCTENKGAHKLKLQVYDREDDVLLSLVSRSHRVKVTSEFVDMISRMGIKYSLN